MTAEEDRRGATAFTVETLATPAGGGAFVTDALTIGVFLTDQPAHRLALGADRAALRPLTAGEGWILPPGAAGECLYDADLRFVRARVPAALLAPLGIEDAGALAPQVGAIDPLTRQLVETLAAAAPAPRLYKDTLGQALAAQLARSLAPPSPAAAPLDDRRLRRAVELIEADPAADLPLALLAAEAAMSPFHFARAFKAATGKSPARFVQHARLAQAATLLRTTRLPATEIAHQVGYGDASRFAQHFKRRYGVTPGAYRG